MNEVVRYKKYRLMCSYSPRKVYMSKKLNFEYSAMQGLYWMMYCIAITFAGTYLLDKGYSNKTIGVLLAAGNVLALFLQTIVSSYCDKNRENGLVISISLLSVITIVLNVIMYFMKGESIILSAIMVIFMTIAVSIQPLVNAFCFFMESFGYSINFGIARGIGSLAYAVIAAIMGKLILKYGVGMLNLSVILFVFLQLLLVTIIRIQKKNMQINNASASSVAKASSQEKAKVQLGTIGIFLAGTVFIFFCHAFINNFTMQIVANVGGNSADMGYLQAFSACLELPGMFLFASIARKIDYRKILSLACVFFLIKSIFTFGAHSMTGLYISMVFQAFSFAVFIPASVMHIKKSLPETMTNRGQALFTMMISVGNTFASFIGGSMIDYFGIYTSLAAGIVSTFVGAAMVIFAVNFVKNSIKTSDNS